MPRGARPRIPPGALPASEHDPLQISCPDLFWWQIEAYFAPISREAADTLWSLNTMPATKELPLEVPDPAPELPTSELDRMRAYPLTHRLIAALLDEGKGARSVPLPPPSARSAHVRSSAATLAHEPLWLPQVPNVQKYYELLEQRVTTELRNAGLLLAHDPAHDELATTMANQHFRQLNLSTVNDSIHASLVRRAASEIANQDELRSKKRKRDAVEIEFLQSLINSATKKQRVKYSKLLVTRFPQIALPARPSESPTRTEATPRTSETVDGPSSSKITLSSMQSQAALDDIRRKRNRQKARDEISAQSVPETHTPTTPSRVR